MIDFLKLPSPCYVLDEKLLDANLGTIDRVRRESGAEIIVALKACAMWSVFPELARHSDGATASSAAEARLVFEEFGKPAHTYAPTYTDRNIDEILRCSDHITFNSVSQFERFGQRALISGLSCGLRSIRSIRPSKRTSQPLRSRLAAGRHGRTAGGARRTSDGHRGAAFPRPLRIAPGTPAESAGSRRDAFRGVPRSDKVAQSWAAAI